VVVWRQRMINFSRPSCGAVTPRDVTGRHVPKCVLAFRILPTQRDDGNLSGIAGVIG